MYRYLSSLELQVIQAGVVRARGTIVNSLSSSVYKDFGDSGIELNTPQLVFEIPSSELASVDTTTNGTLILKIVAESDDGNVTEKDMGSVNLLDRWTGTNRYGGRDETVGGDDWLTPLARDTCNAVNEVTWGDFSNMNGGNFPPHSAHTDGKGGDGWYDGYNDIDADTADTMIELLNTAGVGNNVRIVYVTHTATDGNAFYDAYKDITLYDGRRASAVIRNYSGHKTHFHWNMQ